MNQIIENNINKSFSISLDYDMLDDKIIKQDNLLINLNGSGQSVSSVDSNINASLNGSVQSISAVSSVDLELANFSKINLI